MVKNLESGLMLVAHSTWAISGGWFQINLLLDSDSWISCQCLGYIHCPDRCCILHST